MKPAAIDFTVKDLDEAKNFFEQVFDWRFVKFPESYDYYVSRAGSKILPGVNVAIGAIADNPHDHTSLCCTTKEHGFMNHATNGTVIGSTMPS